MKTPSIRPGQLVYRNDEAAIVLEIKGLTEVIVRFVESRKTEVVQATALRLELAKPPEKPGEHMLRSDTDWDNAMARYELIRPVLQGQKTASDVAAEAGKSAQTIYRWVARFRETGLVSSLLRPPRSDKGETRLTQEQEDIIRIQIETYYLKAERPVIVKLHKNIATDCNAADIQPPDINTVRARVYQLDKYKKYKARYGPKAAREKLLPMTGSFPGATFPNAVVQLDHTPMDIEIVDDVSRRAIGKPNLTMAIDVNSRMISGFYISLDPVGTLSAGLCIGRAVMQKEKLLASMDLHASWPVYGKMAKIHMDNAAEFRGKTFARACDKYDIIVEHRLKGHPNYGPHIESAFRTFMAQVHELPGTTFSSVGDKLDYDSAGRACLTLSELEKWFTIFVVYEYHNKAHEGLCKIPPIKAYNNAVHGTADTPGTGLPAAIADEETFRIDFLPYEMRTIQRDGTKWDYAKYYKPVLRRWIDDTEPGETRKTRKYLFARDPRDISIIYFLDPEDGKYYDIPFYNITRGSVSLWEWRASRKALQEDPHNQVDEQTIYEGVLKRRALLEEAEEKTRAQRKLTSKGRAALKHKQRARGWAAAHAPVQAKEPVQPDFTQGGTVSTETGERADTGTTAVRPKNRYFADIEIADKS